jgi:HEAT repeat protein/cyclophilin family peptidyl-prolyl cis-trans isomerase
MPRSSSPSLRVLLASVLLAVLASLPARAARRGPPAPSRIDKLARLLQIEDTREPGSEELKRLVADPDPGIRRRAALAAGRLADPALVPGLVALMNDQEVEVRRMAAFALGLVGDKAAVPRLLAALKDSDAVVRARAAEALGRTGDTAVAGEIARLVVEALPKTIDRMTVRGDDPGSARDSWVEQRLCLFALARLKDVAAARLALLSDGKPRFDWWAATWVATRLESPVFLPVLRAAARSDDPRSRALAARGLGALKDASDLDLLSGLARDEDETVAFSAVRALGALGDARAVPVVATLLGARSDVLRREALRALTVLPPDRGLRTRVTALAGDREPWIRAAALPALAHIDRESFALVLSGMDPDPVWWVRSALASALGEAGDEVSVAILHSMLQDEDARVLPAVLHALRVARGADSFDTLRRSTESTDLGVRVAAAQEIAALSAPGSAAPLRAAWRRGLSDGPGELEARLAAVEALFEVKGDEARAGLAEAARADPSRAVRARAAADLAALGGELLSPGVESVLRPWLDYREAMAPYDPKPGVDLYTPRAFIRTRRGTIEVHLDVVEAPLTSASFVALARRGFYDGLVFHRVEPGFVVQGGCPRGDGNGGPGYTLRCEMTRQPYGRGAVGMALSGKDTGGSQFFITLSPQPQLDGGYTLFGHVVSGMEIVDRIRPGDVIERVDVWTGGE